ncbi:MAG: Ig-like domain-containing protein [Longimicrobiales bacterium]
MSRATTAVAIVMVVSLVASCGFLAGEACTDDLSWRVTPTEATLDVGESTTVKAEALGCGGTEPLEEDMRWSSEDPSVASVDPITGLITGHAEGSTTVTGEDLGRYGIGPVVVPVVVEP